MMTSKVLAVAVALSLLTETAAADVVVTTKGLRREGVVADREQFANNPYTTRVISLLVASADSARTELVRIAATDVEYVILQDGEQRRVFDLQNPIAAPTTPSMGGPADSNLAATRNESRANMREGGTVLTLVGAGMLAVGAFVKFGAPERGETEKQFNSTNYLMLAGGGVTLVGGIVLLAIHDAMREPANEAHVPGGVEIGVRVGF